MFGLPTALLEDSGAFFLSQRPHLTSQYTIEECRLKSFLFWELNARTAHEWTSRTLPPQPALVFGCKDSPDFPSAEQFGAAILRHHATLAPDFEILYGLEASVSQPKS
jgi:hypothetical protein